MYDSYGVLHRESSDTSVTRAVEEIKLVGYSTIDSGYTKDEIETLKFVCAETALDYKTKYMGYNLESTGEANNHRAPLLQNDIFLEIASNKNVLSVISNLIIGSFFLNQQNLVVNPPSSKNYNQLKFHRDLPYQHYVSTRPLAINALLAVDDFTIQNGATIVIPGSHKFENFSSDAIIEKQSRQIEVNAGTFLILDCMTYHAAGSNGSIKNRVGINHVYSSLMLRPQIDWNRALDENKKLSLNSDQFALLGLNQKIAGSVDEFLSSRMNR